MQKNHFLFGRLKKKQYLCSRFENYGTLPERLGIGLQNRGRRFESARYLQRAACQSGFFYSIMQEIEQITQQEYKYEMDHFQTLGLFDSMFFSLAQL